MSSSRLVRGAKTRMFACICVICLLGALVYVFHGTQTKLADVQKLANSCNQQQESLSAQLQVIFEYKLRLEKSLKKEKADHQSTKEACEVKKKEDKDVRDKEALEANKKYEALLQQCKLQKMQYDDEKEEVDKKLASLLDEKKQWESNLQTAKEEVATLRKDKDDIEQSLKTDLLRYQNEVKKYKEENESLQSKILPADDRTTLLEKQNSQLRLEVKELKNSLSDCKGKSEGIDKAKSKPEETLHSVEVHKVGFSASANGSTTPGVNPDAVQDEHLSSVRPVVRSSEESLPAPLAVPDRGGAGPPQLQAQQPVGQIPGPPDNNIIGANIPPPPDSAIEDHAGEIHDNNLGPMNPIADAPFPNWSHQRQDKNNAIDEEEEPEPHNFRPRERENAEIPRPGRAQEGYHGGDYDGEPPEEEEDDEGEQIDYQQGNNHKEKADHLRAQPHVRIVESHFDNGKGIMVNPK